MKKKLAATLSVVLILGLAVLGILAYLTDTDSDVNVMTLGNVSIEQLEKQRVEQSDNNTADTNLEGFDQYKPLYPAVGDIAWAENNQKWPTGGSSALFADELKNVQDKFVFVANTGKSDAYVRTWIAFEQGDLTAEELSKLLHVNVNGTHWTGLEDSDWTYDVEIDGNKYAICCGVYQRDAGKGAGVLPAGETTRPSLLQVFLDSSATNEDVEAIDGNKDGKYNILTASQAIQTEGFTDAAAALIAGFGDAHPFDGIKGDTWTADADISWYNEEDTVFELKKGDELAGLEVLVDAGNTFEGKTIKLKRDISLYKENENGEPKCFDPIGSYKYELAFKGTFDGQGHTIGGLNQNTWELNNGYAYNDLGMGLFGLVEDAEIKDLKVDNASISGESAICGIVAGCAYGDCTFENITVTNSQAADYQYYAGGIVGWASGNHQYINCDVNASTTIAAQWGDFDNSTGGVIGGAGGSAEIFLKDCDVACRIDAYNDVTSSYQWYAYRRCGMLIGNPGKTQKVGNTTYAAAPQLTCENVTVIYDDWANYTYCEFAGKSWPYVRVQAGISNSAYSNPRYGHPTDANGKEVVDDNHVHNAGEDHQILCEFDQLYGGGQGVYGWPTHDGVKVIYNNK